MGRGVRGASNNSMQRTALRAAAEPWQLGAQLKGVERSYR